MLARIILFVLVSGAAFWVWTSLRRRNQARIREMPERWRLLAAVDDRLQEAVHMRDRLAELAGRADNNLDREVVYDVDELIASVSDVVELRIELERHLRVLDRARLEKDAEMLDEDTAERQKRMLATVDERPEQLNGEIVAAVGDLQNLYLHVLDNLQNPELSSDSVVQTARDRAAALRTRLEAERELKTFLEDEGITVH